MSLEPLAELTYTSFDPPAGQHQGPGGWQVKDLRVTGPLSGSDAEQTLLAHLRWQLQPVRPAPKFPDAPALEVRTRRLVHRAIDESVNGLWHTVEAGPDASGRPGNVFVHALLYDRTTTASRAVDTWRSPDWLVPFGAGEVTAAGIGDRNDFRSGSQITAAALVDFLTEPPPAPDRTQLLGALVDATAAALTGGAGVLLLADSADEAAGWIGAISHCTSAAVANAITWSTFERGGDLTDEAVRTLHVVAVPRTDSGTLPPGHGRVVVALDEEPVGDEEAWWTLASGQAVERTAWSELAMATLARDRRYAVAALEALRESPGERAPLWGVRPAVALGIHVLDTETSDLSPTRQSALRSFWIDHACVHRDDDEASARAYVTAAINDDWWLLMPGAPVPTLRPAQAAEAERYGSPAPLDSARGPWSRTDMAAVCHPLGLRAEQIVTAGQDPGEDLIWAVARGVVLIDFCVRAGLATDEPVVDAARNTGEAVGWALATFGEGFAREVSRRCGPLDQRTSVYLGSPPQDSAGRQPGAAPPTASPLLRTDGRTDRVRAAADDEKPGVVRIGRAGPVAGNAEAGVAAAEHTGRVAGNEAAHVRPGQARTAAGGDEAAGRQPEHATTGAGDPAAGVLSARGTEPWAGVGAAAGTAAVSPGSATVAPATDESDASRWQDSPRGRAVGRSTAVGDQSPGLGTRTSAPAEPRADAASVPATWVEEALGFGVVEVPDPSDQQAARETLAELGLNPQQPFMTALEVSLRPHSEQVALAVLASLVVAELPVRRFRRGGEEGEHRLLTARRLLDGGDATAPRLAAFAVEAMLGAALAERSKAVTAAQIRDERSPYARLLREILTMDAQRGSRIGRLLVQPPTDEARQVRDVVADSAAGEYASLFLRAWDADRGEP